MVRYPGDPPAPGTENRPLETEHDDYVSSDKCRACHPAEYATWDASYHSKMTQVATPETVLAPFDGTEHTYGPRTWVFERRGDEFWVELDDVERQHETPVPRVWRQIVQTTGSHHQQFYWYKTGNKRELAIVHMMYSLRDEPRWMPLDACCVSPPGNLYEAGFGRWSWNCVRCHATHGKPKINPDNPRDIDTEIAEYGIACEACHGPGAEHIEVNQDPRRRYALHDSDEGDDTTINPASLSHRRSAMVCGNCHSVNLHKDEEKHGHWNDNGYSYRPGGDWSEWRNLIKTGSDKFWSDGVIRVSGREYNGLVETPCFQHGEMSCLSCHVLHKPDDDPRALEAWANDQLKVGMDGNRACTQCHEQFEDSEILTGHTHHEAESSGSECYNCHMPYTAYGLLKAIRNHQLDIPNVQASLDTGRPNPCNQCHLDQTLAWAADHLNRWYDVELPSLNEEQRETAASILWALKGEAGQRALMAWSFGWDEARAASRSDWLTPYILMLMNDQYDAVRFIAERSYRKQPDAAPGDYEFMAAPDERLKWMLGNLRNWTTRIPINRTRGPHLLIDANGVIEIAQVEKFLENRDHREVTLNE